MSRLVTAVADYQTATQLVPLVRQLGDLAEQAVCGQIGPHIPLQPLSRESCALQRPCGGKEVTVPQGFQPMGQSQEKRNT